MVPRRLSMSLCAVLAVAFAACALAPPALASRGRVLPVAHGDAAALAARHTVWDGATLLGETGLNHLHHPIWRATYVPGPAGADSPQVHIEEEGSINQSLALVRDELGSVIAIAEDRTPLSVFPLRARVFYSPLGEAHLETGPQPRAIAFDAALVGVGEQQQTTTGEPASAPGGLRLVTTTPIQPESATTGARIERWDHAASTWSVVDPATIAAGIDPTDDTALVIVPLAGWVRQDTYRVTLTAGLKDHFGRSFQLPSGTSPGGLAFTFDVPRVGAPSFKREWQLSFDTVAAASATLERSWPGGVTALYGGRWHDPVTGHSLAGGACFDARSASFLDEGEGDGSLYAIAGGVPHGAPSHALWVAPDFAWAEAMRGAPAEMPRIDPATGAALNVVGMAAGGGILLASGPPGWLALAAGAGYGVYSRHEQAVAAGRDNPLAAGAVAFAGDLIGATSAQEWWTGEELFTGRTLSTDERHERAGTAVGTWAAIGGTLGAARLGALKRVPEVGEMGWGKAGGWWGNRARIVAANRARTALLREQYGAGGRGQARLRSSPGTYFRYAELRERIRAMGLSGRGEGLETHHLVEKRFAATLGLDSDEIISVALTPKWHRNVGGWGETVSPAITRELRALGVSPGQANAVQIWQAHRNVYQTLGRREWAEAIYRAYFEARGVAY